MLGCLGNSPTSNLKREACLWHPCNVPGLSPAFLVIPGVGCQMLPVFPCAASVLCICHQLSCPVSCNLHLSCCLLSASPSTLRLVLPDLQPFYLMFLYKLSSFKSTLNTVFFPLSPSIPDPISYLLLQPLAVCGLPLLM